MGLRLKFNLVVAPLVAIVVALAVWADYRHESAVVMESHAMHTATVGSVALTQPVDPALLPGVVANRSLRMHVVFGALLLTLLIAAINGTLHVFVFGPLTRLRARLLRMEHGHWRDPVDKATTEDEIGRLVQSFQLLGPEIDALVGQSLHAERLAVLALLARHLQGQFEPELRGEWPLGGPHMLQAPCLGISRTSGTGIDRRPPQNGPALGRISRNAP
jgi:hypothetical protein